MFYIFEKNRLVKEIWYSAKGLPYPENDPNYYDVKDFPELLEIEHHWPEIKEELRKFIEEKDKSFEVNKYQNVQIEGNWNSLTYIFWGGIISMEFYKKCPIFGGYLRKVKGMISLSLSRFAPHSSIGRHRGDTNSVIRCHLGIEVPAGLPTCGLKVREEEKGWEEGKWLLFNDACVHSAWNNSDKRRIVLIIDIVRPEYLRRTNGICAHNLAYQFINNKIGRDKPLKDSSFFIKYVLFGAISTSLLIYRPLQNFVKRLF